MRVFQPQPTEGFEWIVVDDPDAGEQLRALGTEPCGTGWRAPPAHRLLAIDGEPRRPADLPWLGSHVLVVTQRARDVLDPVLADAVELLPLAVDDGTPMWVTHALRHEPALDTERSELRRFGSSDRIMRIVRHELHPDVVAAAGPAFKLAAMPRGALYVTEAVVAAAAQAGLTGARFEEIWRAG